MTGARDSVHGHVMTVLGPVAPGDLGVTLSHEHLLADLRALRDDPPPERAHLVDAELTIENRGEVSRNPYDSLPNLLLDDPALMEAELRHFRVAGGRTVVDLTTVGLGPRPDELRALATRTGLHLVAGCGYYRWSCLPASALDRTDDQLAGDLRRALREGLDGTTVRAGIMGELGTSSPIHPFEERQLRAAALVQRETGAAINVHPSIWAHEHLRVLDVLEAAGADLGRVVLSHCDELVEPEWQARIAERGAVLSFDTFGSEFSFDREGQEEPRDTERVACLLRLLEAGRAAQVVLSHDVCTRLQLRRYGGWGFDHLLRHILPRLRQAGVAQRELDAMLIETPRRLLALPGTGA